MRELEEKLQNTFNAKNIQLNLGKRTEKKP